MAACENEPAAGIPAGSSSLKSLNLELTLPFLGNYNNLVKFCVSSEGVVCEAVPYLEFSIFNFFGLPMEVITTHVNADFDYLASMVAAAKFYPEAKLVFAG